MAIKKAVRKVAAKVRKISPADVRKVRDAIEQGRRQGKHEHFEALTDEDIRKKLGRVNTPFFNFFAWSNAPPGGSFALNAGVFNPDPVTVGSMYAHVYIGPGLAVPDNGIGLLNVDARFNRLTEPQFFGLSLAPSASATLSFTVSVPAGMERSNYFGNVVLIRRKGFDVSDVFDRGSFVFRVT